MIDCAASVRSRARHAGSAEHPDAWIDSLGSPSSPRGILSSTPRDGSALMVPALIVHGGAGGDPDDKPTYREALGEALRRGWAILRRGGSALDAIEADRPVDGGAPAPERRLRLGAHRARHRRVRRLHHGRRHAPGGRGGRRERRRSAIGLARRILEDGRHILLVGEGARRFARDQGLAAVLAGCARDRPAAPEPGRAPGGGAGDGTARQTSGTVGAVAIDVHGRIVAGTSTGGYTGKRPGRVGDSALIGSGTYADSRLGGVSTTGHGEAFIRTVLAKTALDILKDLDDPQLAADVSLDIVAGGRARKRRASILMDWRGRLAYATSTTFMPVGWCQGTAAEPVLPF